MVAGDSKHTLLVAPSHPHLLPACHTDRRTHARAQPQHSPQDDLLVWHDLLHAHEQGSQHAMEATELGITVVCLEV